MSKGRETDLSVSWHYPPAHLRRRFRVLSIITAAILVAAVVAGIWTGDDIWQWVAKAAGLATLIFGVVIDMEMQRHWPKGEQ